MNRKTISTIVAVVVVILGIVLIAALVRACHEQGEQPQGGDDEITRLVSPEAAVRA